LLSSEEHLKRNFFMLRKLLSWKNLDLNELLPYLQRFCREAGQNFMYTFISALNVCDDKIKPTTDFDSIYEYAKNLHLVLGSDKLSTQAKNGLLGKIEKLDFMGGKEEIRADIILLTDVAISLHNAKRYMSGNSFDSLKGLVSDNIITEENKKIFIENLKSFPSFPLEISLTLSYKKTENTEFMGTYRDLGYFSAVSEKELKNYCQQLKEIINIFEQNNNRSGHLLDLHLHIMKNPILKNVGTDKLAELHKALSPIYATLNKLTQLNFVNQMSCLYRSIKQTNNFDQLLSDLLNFREALGLAMINLDKSCFTREMSQNFDQKQSSVQNFLLPWINALIKRDSNDRGSYNYDWKSLLKLISLASIAGELDLLKFDPEYTADKLKKFFTLKEWETINNYLLQRQMHWPAASWPVKYLNKKTELTIDVSNITDNLNNIWHSAFAGALDEFSPKFRELLNRALAQKNSAEGLEQFQKALLFFTYLAKEFSGIIKSNSRDEINSVLAKIFDLTADSDLLSLSLKDIIGKKLVNPKDIEEIKTSSKQAYEEASFIQKQYAVAMFLTKIYDPQSGVENKIKGYVEELKKLMHDFQFFGDILDIPNISSFKVFNEAITKLGKNYKNNKEVMKLVEQGQNLLGELKSFFEFLKHTDNRLKGCLKAINEEQAYDGYISKINTLIKTDEPMRNLQVTHELSSDPYKILSVLRGECLDFVKGSNTDKLISIILNPTFLVSYFEDPDKKTIFSNLILRLVELNKKQTAILVDKQYGYYGTNLSSWWKTLEDVFDMASEMNVPVIIPQKSIQKMNLGLPETAQLLKETFPAIKIKQGNTSLVFLADLPNHGYTDISENAQDMLLIYPGKQETTIETSVISNPKKTAELIDKISALKSTSTKSQLLYALKKLINLYKARFPGRTLKVTAGLLYKLANPDMALAHVMYSAFQYLMNANELGQDYDKDTDWFTISSSSTEVQDFLAKQLGQNKTILSLGLGKGVFEKQLPTDGHKVFGIDLARGLSKVASNNGIQVIKGDAQKLPELIVKHDLPEKYDHILFMESLGDMDVRQMLRTAAGHLRGNGTVEVLTYLPLPDNNISEAYGYERFFSTTFQKIANESGLKLDKRSTRFWEYNNFRGTMEQKKKESRDGIAYYRLQKTANS
ncbi:MAG: hypothetical protein PHV30_11645, partial [Candidatus Margulisbacteria bacterium]|nr:hypothetical protein [Candidatus Margulisiibacteriota bacterium]